MFFKNKLPEKTKLIIKNNTKKRATRGVFRRSQAHPKNATVVVKKKLTLTHTSVNPYRASLSLCVESLNGFFITFIIFFSFLPFCGVNGDKIQNNRKKLLMIKKKKLCSRQREISRHEIQCNIKKYFCIQKFFHSFERNV